MPTVWEVIEDDVADIMAQDGVEAKITTAGGTVKFVNVFWEGESSEGGDLSGQRVWCADADLPSGTLQAGTLVYPVTNGTTYTIAQKENDGHGMTAMLLIDETEV